MELFLLLLDFLVGGIELRLLGVLPAVLLLHLLHLLLQRFLLLQQLLQCGFFLPTKLFLFHEFPAQFAHLFPQAAGLLEVFLQCCRQFGVRTVELLGELLLRGGGIAEGPRPGHLGPIDAVVVADFKPVLHLLSEPDAYVGEVPEMQEGVLPATGQVEVLGFNVAPLGTPDEAQVAETIVVLHDAVE